MRSFFTLAGGVLAGLILASPSLGQGQTDVVQIDLGLFGNNSLAIRNPAFYYRPISTSTARPGAAALGLGGAYLARATDAMAVGWTPAGLAEVSGLSVVADGALVRDNSTADGYPEQLTIPLQPPLFITNYNQDLRGRTGYGVLAMATPLWTGQNQKLVGALSWRRYNETAAPEQTVLDMIVEQGGTFPVTIASDRTERGAIEAYGPSLAFQIAPGMSVGASANILTGRLRTSAETNINAGGGDLAPGRERFTQKYKGFSMDLGARASIGSWIQLAGVYTPEYTVEVTGGQYFFGSIAPPGVGGVELRGKLAGYDLTLPAALGAGVAVQPHNRVWLSADYTLHPLEDAELKYNGPVPIDTANPTLPLRDEKTLAFGLEYVLLRPAWGEIPVRLGFRSSDLPYAQADSSDYNYIYSYQNPFLTQEERDAITRFETMTIVFDGTPSGDAVDGTGFSFGTSIRTDRVSYDLGFDFFSYTEKRFFFNSPWDATLNPNPIEGTPRVRNEQGDEFLPPSRLHPNLIEVDRSVTTIRLSASLLLPDFF